MVKRKGVEAAVSPPGDSTRRAPAAASISPEGGGGDVAGTATPPSLRRPRLAPRQKVALEFIEVYIDRHGYPPTLKEIALGMGINSKSTALFHVNALERKGYIEIGDARKAMQLRVVP